MAVMTDMTEHQDADTVIDAAIRDAVMATDTVMMVTIEDSAAMAGVSVRTIRRWRRFVISGYARWSIASRSFPARTAGSRQSATSCERSSLRRGRHAMMPL
jgi:hypothetical protein